MALNWKRLFWGALIAGPLLYATLSYRAGGRMQCLGSDYERFEFYRSGVRQGPIPGASPTVSIIDQGLIPPSVKAGSAFYNVTDLLECARPEEDASRISFVELRSAALTRAVERWRARRDPASGFRGGDLWKDRVIVSFDTDRPGYRVWDPAYVQAVAPAWLAQSQLKETHWIAFWGDGHLFQGSAPDQYYWIGYR